MTDFVKESPLSKAARYANEELRGRADGSQVSWLYENPLLWLRALVEMERSVNNAIAKSRLDLEPLKPIDGESASAEYLKAKAEIGAVTQGRLHFKGKVEARMNEVKSILGPEKIDRLMVADLIEVFLSISYAADSGELESAADQAMFWAKALAARSENAT